MLERTNLVFLLLVAIPAIGYAQTPDTTPPATPPATTEPPPMATGATFQKGTLGFELPIATDEGIVLLGGTDQVTVVDILYFLNDKTALDLIAGINLHYEQVADNSTPPVLTGQTVFGFELGLGYRMYTHKGVLHSYLEPTVKLGMTDSSVSESFFLNGGLQLGAERMLNDWLSLSGAFGAAVNFTNSFKDIRLGPTATLAVNFYWR
jgi:hypothetical protein